MEPLLSVVLLAVRHSMKRGTEMKRKDKVVEVKPKYVITSDN